MIKDKLTTRLYAVALTGLLLCSMLFVSSTVFATDNPYEVVNWKTEEEGTKWYYNITFTKGEVFDISYLKFEFSCEDDDGNLFQSPVYISDAGGDCIKDIETDCGELSNNNCFPCDTYTVKWEFNDTCFNENYDDGEVTLIVWFSTWPNVYEEGPLYNATTKGGTGVSEVEGLKGPYCGVPQFVIPELPFGTLMGLATMLGTAALYKYKKR